MNKLIMLIFILITLIGCGEEGGKNNSSTVLSNENNSSLNQNISLITQKSITTLDNGETGFPSAPDIKINDNGQAYALWNDCYSYRKFSYYNGFFWQDPIITSISNYYSSAPATGDLSCNSGDGDFLLLNDNGDAAIIRNTIDDDYIRITYVSNGNTVYTIDINGSLDFIQNYEVSSEQAVINNDGIVYIIYDETEIITETEYESSFCYVTKLAILDHQGLVKIEHLNVSKLPCENHIRFGDHFISLNTSQQAIIYGSDLGYSIYNGTEKLVSYDTPLSRFSSEENFLFMYSETEGYIQRFQAYLERITHISPQGAHDIDLPSEFPRYYADLSSMTVTENGNIYLSKVINCPRDDTSLCNNITQNEAIIAVWKYENGIWSEPLIVFQGFLFDDFLLLRSYLKTKFIYIKDEVALLAYGENKTLYKGCLFNGISCSETFEIDGPLGVLSPAYDLNKNGELMILGDIHVNTNINVSLHEINLSSDE